MEPPHKRVPRGKPSEAPLSISMGEFEDQLRNVKGNDVLEYMRRRASSETHQMIAQNAIIGVEKPR
jgi:hypothetical protein